jgi:hypothetical protein
LMDSEVSVASGPFGFKFVKKIADAANPLPW